LGFKHDTTKTDFAANWDIFQKIKNKGKLHLKEIVQNNEANF